jgi:hypothetical protein
MNTKIAVSGVLSTFLLASTVFAQAVTSDDFVLKNTQGEVTARLTTSGEGTPALFFYDANKKVRISIGLYSDGVPGVVLNDENEKAGAIMRLVTNQGNPVVVLKENGQDKIIIDKNGLPKSSTTSQIVPLALATLFGFLGGLLSMAFSRKKENVATQFVQTPVVTQPVIQPVMQAPNVQQPPATV